MRYLSFPIDDDKSDNSLQSILDSFKHKGYEKRERDRTPSGRRRSDLYDAGSHNIVVVTRERKRERGRPFEECPMLQGRERNRGLRTMLNGDDGGERRGRAGVGGGGSGDVLAKVTAGNAVYVRRSKVACRVAQLSLSVSLSLPSLCCPLGYRYSPLILPRPPAPPASSLFLSRALEPAARRRLQECTKCTALTDARPRSTASTCLLRPFASPCSFSLAPSLCFSLSLLRGPWFLFSPVGYSASAGHSRILYIVLPPPPLPGTVRFSTTVCWCASLLSPPRPRDTHARIRVQIGTQKKYGVVVPGIHTGSYIATRVLAPFFSLFLFRPR